jgi:Lrp/AsnC family leucine-responsive transcriptional regulator
LSNDRLGLVLAEVPLPPRRVAEAHHPQAETRYLQARRITGADYSYLKLHLRSIDELATVLDRFLAYGETTTSIINTSPIPHREPPVLETT